MHAIRVAALAALSVLARPGDAFSLPGVQMTTYKKGDAIPLFVNSLTSSETLLPLDYFKLGFCKVRRGTLYVLCNVHGTALCSR
jgi:hypothetical protein